jgi:hypothetical protein
MTSVRRKSAATAQVRQPASPAARTRPPRDAAPVPVPAETSDRPKPSRRRRARFVL